MTMFRSAFAIIARTCSSTRLLARLPAASAKRPGRSRRWRRALAQSRESSVIGGEPLSLAGATLLNAYLVTAVTMCDVHRATLTHVTPEVVPPALAIAERDGLSGRELLTALAAGCEVTTRIGLGLDYPKFRARGWHGPGIIGPFGAAAAVGSLLDFDADTMARAFGLAGSQAAGTFAAWGTPTVKFHQCRGALSGLMAALLAQQQFVATREFLTAKDGGLYNAYVDGGKPDAAVAELGTRWELEQIAMRLWPSASLIQGMVTALFDLLDRRTIDAGRVREVRIGLSQRRVHNARRIQHLQSQVRSAVVGALHRGGDPARSRVDLRAVRAGALRRAKLRRFAAGQVEVRAEPSVSGSQAIVDIEIADGTTLSAHCEHRSARSKIRCRAHRSSKNSAPMPMVSCPTPRSRTSSVRSSGWRISARSAG